MLYEVENLEKAREFLESARTKIVLSNPQGSTRYYGMRVIDYIFKVLQQEFPEKISGVVVNAYDDYSAFVSARKLGYREIQYFNRAV
jgi:phage baseplate assembly protein W